jgi:DivIVA domain-containing protein
MARIRAALNHEDGAEQQLTGNDVRRVQFRTTRFGGGYDEAAVDAALDRYAAELDGHTS